MCIGALATEFLVITVGDGKLMTVGTVGVGASWAVIIARLCSETGGSLLWGVAVWYVVVFVWVPGVVPLFASFSKGVVSLP